MARAQGSEARPAGGAGASAAALADRLGELLGEPLVGELERLSSGASRESFRFATPSRGALVVQLDRRGRAGGRAQAQLLRAAAGTGVPVAHVVSDGADDPVLGPSWIVMEELAGSTDPARILQARGSEALALIDSIAAALAAVHRMPADGLRVPAVADPLAELRQSYERLGEPHPTFELAFRALAAGPPAPARRALVHGDFRIGNLMIAAGRVTGVLDWELAHVGDPVEDLGWLCVPAWRFTRPDRPAAGLAARAQLLAAYARHSGCEVDPAALRWWELAGTLRWGVICVMQAFAHLSGAIDSIEHAVIGRRACEVEWDLLELLAPPGAPASGRTPPTPVTATPARPRLHDRPTASELLDAARGALGDRVLPLLEGRAAFELRVTLRALGIVRRELDGAERHAAVRAAALARLGVADEAELAAAIRAGALQERAQELYEALRAIVRAKLEVANPRYLQAATCEQKEGP